MQLLFLDIYCLQIFMIKHSVLNYFVYNQCTYLSLFYPRSNIAELETTYLHN